MLRDTASAIKSMERFEATMHAMHADYRATQDLNDYNSWFSKEFFDFDQSDAELVEIVDFPISHCIAGSAAYGQPKSLFRPTN